MNPNRTSQKIWATYRTRAATYRIIPYIRKSDPTTKIEDQLKVFISQNPVINCAGFGEGVAATSYWVSAVACAFNIVTVFIISCC
jgi:hypothetical protein